jgi:hypothetical protein
MVAAQPNAPLIALDEADTRQRTREVRRKSPPSPAPSFADDRPEDTVSARPRPASLPAVSPNSPAPPPPASSAAATVLTPPSQNPLASNRPSSRTGFEEPTRIPPAQPPPLDSGRFVPGIGLEEPELPYLSPLGDPEPRLRPRTSRGVWVGAAVIGLIAIGGAAAVTLSGAGDTRGSLSVVSLPPGAEAIVNGRIRGMTPTTVGDLPPNDDVVIELRLRGYKVAHKTVSWGGKRLLDVSIPLEKAK